MKHTLTLIMLFVALGSWGQSIIIIPQNGTGTPPTFQMMGNYKNTSIYPYPPKATWDEAVGRWGQNADTIKKGWIQINDKTWIHSEPEITITPEKNPNPVAYLTSYGRTIIAINRKYIIVFNDSGNIIGKIAYKGQLEMGSRYDSFKTFTPINLDSL